MSNLSITNTVSESIYDAIRNSGGYADNISIGDTDHADGATREFLSSEELMKSLAEAEASHICIELAKDDIEPIIQDYQNGETKRELFVTQIQLAVDFPHKGGISKKAFAESIADTVERANKYGMEVHAVDSGKEYTGQPNMEALAILGKYASAFGQEKGIEINETTMEQHSQEFFQFFEENLTEEDREQFQKLNRLDDTELHQNIESATNGEKAVIIYGAAHDHVAALMEGETLVIDVVKNTNHYHEEIEDLNIGFDQGQPDLVYSIDEDVTYATSKLASPFSENITLDTIDTSQQAPELQNTTETLNDNNYAP